MKKRMILTVVLAVLLIGSVLFPAAAAERFTDVPADAWYVSYVDYAVEHGIFNGISATQFAPGKTMNRAQFVQVLANLSEIDTTDTNVTTPFSDVPAGKWFSPAVKWAYENGIVNGKGGGKFAPGDNVNRQEMCTMLARYADYLGVRLTKTAEKTVFADDASISSWAKDAVYACQQAELINGIGGNKFNPKGTTPRSQGATLFARFHQYLTNQAHTHVFGEWVVAIPATCLREGEMRRTCACGVYEPKVIPAMGTGAHIEVIDPAVDPTTTSTGLTEGKHCSICNTVLVPQQTIPKLYDYREYNPLLAENKPINTGISPSFDIDTTNFVKNNVKLADLKGKTFTLITSVKYGVFNYYGPNEEYLSEWDWFEGLKEEYGLNIKCIESRYTEAISQILTFMNAGKSLDLIPTHRGGLPLYLNLSQPLDPYIHPQYMNNSPGVNLKTLEQTRYGGGYRCISPIGAVDVLFYNQSLVEELGLQDPHKLWQQDKWDWNAWQNFVHSIPTTTSDGKPLTPYGTSIDRDWYSWPMTNGVSIIDLDTENREMNLINNWMDERTLQAMDFYTDVVKSLSNMNNGKTEIDMYADGTIMMAPKTTVTRNLDDYEYAGSHKYNWVPYPKSPYEDGQYVAMNSGYTMMIPKKVKTQSNVPYAVKFAELWATRFTEAMLDYFATSKAYRWTYQQRKEYFEFAAENSYFGISMFEWRHLTGANFDAMRKEGEGLIWAITDKNLNYRTIHTKVANVVEQAIIDSIQFAQ